jgi:multimeric flavodoxin WrbA
MENSVLLINGSIRVDGNTDILVAKITEGAKDIGINTSLIELKNKKILNCNGCYVCLNKSTCSLEDDMTDIYNQINKAEIMIFLSPLYWCGVTGLMKTFIDRLFFYYHPQNKKLISGKKAIIVTVMNQKDTTQETEILIDFYNRLFASLEIKLSDKFLFGDVMGKGAILNKDEYLHQAYSIGRNLNKLIKK